MRLSIRSWFRRNPTAAQSLPIAGNLNTAVQVIGSNIKVSVNPAIELEVVPVSHRLILTPPKTEVDLLNPYRRTLPLLGREADLASLHTFLNTPRPISIRTIIGRAGAGKTRLAIDLMLQLAPPTSSKSPPWTTGFLTGDSLRRFVASPNLAQWGWPTPTLIVIDYAATLLDSLRAFLRHLSDRTLTPNTPPLRILLFERQASAQEGWLSSLTDHSWSDRVATLFDPLEPVRVQTLPTPIRRQLFSAMLATASDTLHLAAPTVPPPGESLQLDLQFNDPVWEDPLYLMMAAIVSLHTNLSAALSLSRPDLALYVAQRELTRIESFAPQDGSEDQRHAARQLLAFLAAHATLNAGLSHAHALTLANAECAAHSLTYPGGPGALVQRLHSAFPAPDHTLAPVLPDIIGEAFILHTLRRLSKNDQAAFVLRSVQSHGRTVPDTIIRTTQDFSPCGIDEPLNWLEALIDAGSANDYVLLLAIDSAMPHQTLVLREKAAEVTSIILRRLKLAMEEHPSADISAKIARVSQDLACRLSALARREEALAAAQASVDIRRQLVAQQSDAFRSDLAGALNNLANMLSDMGRREDALTTAQEAVDIHRQLVVEMPNASRPDLALTLNNLATKLSVAGRREDALNTARESVALYRQLAAERPDALRSDMAAALHNLACIFSNLARREDALSAAQGAVDIRRQLAVVQPDAFLPDLVASLNTLAVTLRGMGRQENALTTIQEAVAIYRRLVTEQPDVFRPNLAGTLNNLASTLSELGLRQDALSAAQEAVDIFRQLANLRPPAFRPDLALSLHNLAIMLLASGRRDDALTAAQESTNIRRQLANQQPAAFGPALAVSLNTLGNTLGGLGRGEEALVTAQEAVDILRELAAQLPEAFQPDLAMSLNNLASTFSALGRRQEALASVEEAVDIRRRLAELRPDAFLPNLAAALKNFANMLNDSSRREEALPVAQEAVALYRQLAAARPDAFNPNLAVSLASEAKILRELGDHSQAAHLYRQAIETLAPSFFHALRLFSGTMAGLCLQYVESCREAGAEPSREILEPIHAVFEHLPPSPSGDTSHGQTQ